MPERPLGIGLLGAGWITRAHAHAIRTLVHIAPLPRPVRIVALAARTPGSGATLARDFDIPRVATDWRDVVDDPAVDVVANLTAVDGHRAATEAALAAGKAVLCEKPMARDRRDAARMLAAAAAAAVPAAMGFNYRYVPAMRLMRQIVARGDLGDPVHFRAVYLQDYALGAGFRHNGSAAIGDYAHIVDFVRYLGCEPLDVQASAVKLTTGGPPVEDAYVAAVTLRGGGLGSLEASRLARGRKGRQVVEFNGTLGSAWWDMEDLNRLHVFYASDESGSVGGFHDVLVTQPDHPFLDLWWPPGHTIGWDQAFTHQWLDFLGAVIEGRELSPEQASFDDGYEATLVCDAIRTSATEGRRVTIDEMRATAMDPAPPPMPA
jgi:predicted dehydrogenase